MSEPINIYDAKTRLSELVDRAAAGEEVVIAKAGKPVARLVPLRVSERKPGRGAGLIEIAADFDAPLPDEVFARLRVGRLMAAKPRRPRVGTIREAAAAYSVRRRLLLDTHAWLWWYIGSERLGRNARTLIKRADAVRVSVASVWEIDIKRGLGKLVFHGEIDIARELERDRVHTAGDRARAREAAGRLPPLHRDPFDRILIAQAEVEGLTIVTADPVLSRYGVAVFDACA